MRNFPSIEQYRQVIQSVKHDVSYLGKDAEGKNQYSHSPSFPTIEFKGTIKLHGTNASLGFGADGERWYQSRNCIITPENDNHGFATFCESHKSLFEDLYAQVAREVGAHHSVVLYGEWCGGNVQSGVAITGLPKMYVIFGVKVFLTEDTEVWLHTYDRVLQFSRDEGVYLVTDFWNWTLPIDFENPKLVQNLLGEITAKVEEECPVGKFFGRVKGTDNTTGEGVVWVGEHEGTTYHFKVKGKLHSVSKVKTLAAVDVEKLESINEFVKYAVTENRLDQGIREVNGVDAPDIKKTGQFVSWVISDIIKEESDVLSTYGFSPKDVGKAVRTAASKYYTKKCNRE